MIYAIYYEYPDGRVGLVEILKSKREAKNFIPTTGYFLKAWKHLSHKQVDLLQYAQVLAIECMVEEAIVENAREDLWGILNG